MATESTYPTRRPARPLRKKAAALLAALSVVMMSGGLVLMTAPAATATQDKVGICHRTNSDTMPYTYQQVPADEANGHLTGTSGDHNGQGAWKSDGTFRGVPHQDGEEKHDYLAGSSADCQDTTPPPVKDCTDEGYAAEHQLECNPPVEDCTDEGYAAEHQLECNPPAQDCTNPDYAAAHQLECNPPVQDCTNPDYAAAHQQECTPPVNPTLVTPNAPSQTEPSCSTAGSVIAPAAQAGVNVVRTELGNGSVRFDSTPAAGHVFAGAQTVSATVTALPRLSGASCGEVEGTDESTDEPPTTVKTPEVKTPEVQGVAGGRTPTVKGISNSAPVPSAVEAGLAGQQTDARVLLGEALLGAGLLLFVASGWSGLGTRRRGVRQG